jgi:hypothetical protein
MLPLPTVNVIPLLCWPEASTTTWPLVAAAGTGVTIFVLDQLVGEAKVPANSTQLEPCVGPKPLPVIVIDSPAVPELGESDWMEGTTENGTPLLLAPPDTTVTGPVKTPAGAATVIDVLLHDVGEAGTPLNMTMLDPCAEPKLEPEIVTTVPAEPELGEMAPTLGVTAKLT